MQTQILRNHQILTRKLVTLMNVFDDSVFAAWVLKG